MTTNMNMNISFNCYHDRYFLKAETEEVCENRFKCEANTCKSIRMLLGIYNKYLLPFSCNVSRPLLTENLGASDL